MLQLLEWEYFKSTKLPQLFNMVVLIVNDNFNTRITDTKKDTESLDFSYTCM